MKLKSFYAPSMREAMLDVKKTLGEEAIIVSTQEEGYSIRVTAALDEVHLGGDNNKINHIATHSEDTALNIEVEDDGNDFAIDIMTEILIQHGVPDDVTDAILSHILNSGLEHPRIALVAALEKAFTYQSLTSPETVKNLIFVGPQGAGKTLSLAKLATHYVMRHMEIEAITLDTERAGAVAQLETLMNILDVPCHVATDTQDLARVIENIHPDKNILIDTPGQNVFSSQSIKSVKKMITVSGAEPVLVLPAGMDPYESLDIAMVYRALNITKLLPTRMDTARRYGGILAAAHFGKFTLTDMGVSSEIIGGLRTLHPKRLASFLMPDKR